MYCQSFVNLPVYVKIKQVIIIYFHLLTAYQTKNPQNMFKCRHVTEKSNLVLNSVPLRCLPFDLPFLPYRRRKGEQKLTCHWGQRKLAMAEIEFLCKCATQLSKKLICVYAGAAPGSHLASFFALFTDVRFILVDPSQFNLPDHENIKKYNAFMSVDLADNIRKEYSEDCIVFISDVRSADYRVLSSELNEQTIAQDMENQQLWCKALGARAALLKFRLPWSAGTTTYLAGDICLPVYGPQTTTEARLMIFRNQSEEWSMRDYDNVTYMEQMFYFNTVLRNAHYPSVWRDLVEEAVVNAVMESDLWPWDDCYDCTTEQWLLLEYMRQMPVDAVQMMRTTLRQQMDATASAEEWCRVDRLLATDRDSASVVTNGRSLLLGALLLAWHITHACGGANGRDHVRWKVDKQCFPTKVFDEQNQQVIVVTRNSRRQGRKRSHSHSDVTVSLLVQALQSLAAAPWCTNEWVQHFPWLFVTPPAQEEMEFRAEAWADESHALIPGIKVHEGTALYAWVVSVQTLHIWMHMQQTGANDFHAESLAEEAVHVAATWSRNEETESLLREAPRHETLWQSKHQASWTPAVVIVVPSTAQWFVIPQSHDHEDWGVGMFQWHVPTTISHICLLTAIVNTSAVENSTRMKVWLTDILVFDYLYRYPRACGVSLDDRKSLLTSVTSHPHDNKLLLAQGIEEVSVYL